jgi:hydrogenase-4 component B
MNNIIINNFRFLFDPLSLFFLAVIAIVSLPSLVYSIGYLKNQFSRPRVLYLNILTVFFIISMAGVVISGHLLVFLVAWELMSLVSFFLVAFEYEHEQSIKASVIYIVMTHVGTAFIIAGFMLLYKYCGSFDMEAIRINAAAIPGNIRNLIFIFLLIGFGTKAGIVPLHLWLPYAHPQAPSHISSLMSGVMIKTAVYGIIRFVIYIIGVNTVWWAGLILVFAVISCLVGVIYALMVQDIKKLLAYSSIENMGIILLGIGLAMLFMVLKQPYLAVFSLVAGLFHLINHAIFKGLLFLSAGSVYKATGTRDMEKMGGLIKTMPWTAGFFLLGAMAISGLPPLNGFVSEWMTLQAFFMGAIKTDSGMLKLLFGLGAAALAFTSGLAAACFVKAFGISFLALPRSRQAQEAKEVCLSMRLGMAILAVLIVVLGIFAAFFVKILAKVAGYSCSIDIASMSFSVNNFILSPQPLKGVYLSPVLLGLGLLLFGSGAAISYFIFGKRKVREYKTWDCGYYKMNSRNEYTATGFSKPFQVAFSFFLFPYRRTQKIRESSYHVKSFSHETHTTPVFKRYLYEPLLGMIIKTAGFMRRIQPGSIHLYIGYIMLTVFLLIIFMRKF